MKTAEELGLTKEQFNALVKTLKWLRNDARYIDNADDPGKGRYFNMSVWDVAPHRCDSVGCIGGTAAYFSGNEKLFSGAIPQSEALSDLFYPDIVEDLEALQRITTAQAATALSNYLNYGDARWGKVLHE